MLVGTRSNDNVPSNASTIADKTRQELHDQLEDQLGSGPMRFGPVVSERSIQEEAAGMNLEMDQAESYAMIKTEWESRFKKENKIKIYTDVQILRIAAFFGFDERKAIRFMRAADPRHFQLQAGELILQLESKTLFPSPGLKSRAGYDVFYMRPARYDPRHTAVRDIIDNLAFVMYKMKLQKPDTKLGFLANMNDWKISNFSYDYCRQFMDTLQGSTIPVKVDLFLIMDPPSWFGKIWAIMKPMLATQFRKKVHIVARDDLSFHLADDYLRYLPDDVQGGEVNTELLVQDYIKFHLAIEHITAVKKSATLKASKRRGWFSWFKRPSRNKKVKGRETRTAESTTETATVHETHPGGIPTMIMAG